MKTGLANQSGRFRQNGIGSDLRPDLRVAIIHYWLVGMRGGEKVLEQLCAIFPQADIFTHAYRPDKISPQIRQHRVITTSVGRLPMADRLYQNYLPFMPAALDALDLTNYDLVLSSEAGPAKGVITPVDVPHLCYCHSPMRYIWDQYPVYHQNAGFLTRQFTLEYSVLFDAILPALADRPQVRIFFVQVRAQLRLERIGLVT